MSLRHFFIVKDDTDLPLVKLPYTTVIEAEAAKRAFDELHQMSSCIDDMRWDVEEHHTVASAVVPSHIVYSCREFCRVGLRHNAHLLIQNAMEVGVTQSIEFVNELCPAPEYPANENEYHEGIITAYCAKTHGGDQTGLAPVGRVLVNLDSALNTMWTRDHIIAAAKEGWMLSTLTSVVRGPLQVQSIDDPEVFKRTYSLDFLPPRLGHDHYAWHKFQLYRTTPHGHAAATLLCDYNPAELARIERHCAEES